MDNNLLKTMYKLRNKAEDYWALHNDETRISYGVHIENQI